MRIRVARNTGYCTADSLQHNPWHGLAMKLSVFLTACGFIITLMPPPCRAQPVQLPPQGEYDRYKPRELPPAPRPTLPEPERLIPTDDKVLVDKLVGLRFVDHPSKVREKIEVSGVDTSNVELLDCDEFRILLGSCMGKPVSWNLIYAIRLETIRFYRASDRPVVDVIIPEQDITNGVVQVLVIEGKVGKVTVEGNNWFDFCTIREEVRLAEGDPIHASGLLDDISWLNQNPFRYVRPVLSPGEKIGLTDLTLETGDRFPARFYGGYEDSGNRFTGPGRYLVGINLGNVFGFEHEIGYQFAVDNKFDDIAIHSGYWRIPLPGRRKLAFFGSFAHFDAHHHRQNFHGFSWQVSTRWMEGLDSIGDYYHDLQLGFDFKRMNNDMAYGGTNTYDGTIDIAQFALEYSGTMPDATGETSLSCSGYWSPGCFSSKQDTGDYDAARADTNPQYAYSRLGLDRIWYLPFGASLVNRLAVQVSTDRLPGSEQMGLGGYTTVRGYDIREVNSNQGLFLSVELRSPNVFTVLPASLQKAIRRGDGRGEHNLQFLGFWDFGCASNTGDVAGEDHNKVLQSVGAGLRYRFSSNLSLRVDYGYRLSDPDTGVNEDGRFHVGIIASY